MLSFDHWLMCCAVLRTVGSAFTSPSWGVSTHTGGSIALSLWFISGWQFHSEHLSFLIVMIPVIISVHSDCGGISGGSSAVASFTALTLVLQVVRAPPVSLFALYGSPVVPFDCKLMCCLVLQATGPGFTSPSWEASICGGGCITPASRYMWASECEQGASCP
jgi:hypothetical protein